MCLGCMCSARWDLGWALLICDVAQLAGCTTRSRTLIARCRRRLQRRSGASALLASLSPHGCSTQGGFFCENCLSLSLNKIVPFFALCTERCRHMCRHRRSSSLVGIILNRRWRETWKTQDYHQSPGVCSQSRIHFCWDSAVRSDFCSCCPAQARRRQGQRTVF